jgi:phosphoglycolate phosphatase
MTHHAALITHHSVALVFDLDNTLVHSQIDFPRLRRRMLDVTIAHGLELEPRGAEPLVTAEIMEAARAITGRGSALELALWEIVLEEEQLGMAQASVEADTAHALEVLAGMGARLTVLTNNARPAALTALEKFGLLDYFDFVLARDDVPALKPSPEGLFEARRRLDGASRLAMIGDASIDGLAANRAAVPFIAFRPREADLGRRGVVRWATVVSLVEISALLSELPSAR